MATQDTATFWDSLARVLAGQNQAQIAPVTPVGPKGGPMPEDPNIFQKIAGGWRGTMANPQARSRFQDLSLGLMMGNSGNTLTDLGQAIQYSRQNMEQQRQQQIAEQMAQQKQSNEERRTAAYEKQVNVTEDLGNLRNQTTRELAQLKADNQIELQKLKNQAVLSRIDRMAKAGAYGNSGFNLDRIMVEALVAGGTDPGTAAAEVFEYKSNIRGMTGGFYGTPPSSIDLAVADSTGQPVPTRTGLPPNATDEQRRSKLKEQRPDFGGIRPSAMLIHKTQGKQYQVVAVNGNTVTIKGPTGATADYPLEQVRQVFTVKGR